MKLRFKILGGIGLGIALHYWDSIKIARLIWYNFSNITDYKIFPYRTIHKAEIPYQFNRALGSVPISFDKLNHNRHYESFEHFLTFHKSVAFIIFQNDKILYEHYAYNYQAHSTVTSFSMAKSIIGLLIGLAIKDQLIDSEQDQITQYLPELINTELSSLKIIHLLQMTSGLDFNENYGNPIGEAATFYYGTRLKKNTFQLKLKGPPGDSFEYNSGNTQLLGFILDRVLKEKSISQYLEEKIWKRIGCAHDATWSLDRKNKGIEKTFCCLNAAPIDFLKIGKLLLQNGNWNGEQIIPLEWMNKIKGCNVSDGGSNEYQYHFWKIKDTKAFMAKGHLGQFIYVDPSKNLVLIRLGKAKGGLDWPNILEKLSQQF